MSGIPEPDEELRRRVKAHRAVLSKLISETAPAPASTPSAKPAPRADILVSATMDEWSDGGDRYAYSPRREASEPTAETTEVPETVDHDCPPEPSAEPDDTSGEEESQS